MGEIEILKDALTSLKTKQVQIEQQMALPDSTSQASCACGGRRNREEETAAILRRGDQPLITWLRNQHYDNETILKVGI